MSMNSSWIQFPATDGRTIDAYLALPPSGEGPGLVLWQEIFGVNAHIRGVAEQYAQAGFVVLVPDAFWRQQRRVELGYVGPERDQALALMKAYPPAEQEADVQAAAAALRARPEVGGRKVGAIGYCMGGRLAYLSAALAGVDAAVSYYGGGIQTRLELAPRITVPVLFHYAGHDPSIPPEAVAQVQQALAGKPATFHLYLQAEHGFNCWDRAAYDPASAALAFGRTLTFFAEHLFT
jgi:carboxymethylenebutenolidase